MTTDTQRLAESIATLRRLLEVVDLPPQIDALARDLVPLLEQHAISRDLARTDRFHRDFPRGI